MSLNEAIKAGINNVLAHVHTALPGSVESYDYKKQKASIKPLLKKTFSDGTVLDLPIINNVPVIFLRSGNASLTFPVNKGDTGLIIFAERSLDTWLSKGGNTAPLDTRRFDLSDGIFIPGLIPFSNNSLAENNDDILLKYGNSKISIKKNGDIALDNGTSKIEMINGTVAIKNQTQELLDLIDQLLTALISSITPTVSGPQPLSGVPTMVQIQLKLATLKQVAGI